MVLASAHPGVTVDEKRLRFGVRVRQPQPHEILDAHVDVKSELVLHVATNVVR